MSEAPAETDSKVWVYGKQISTRCLYSSPNSITKNIAETVANTANPQPHVSDRRQIRGPISVRQNIQLKKKNFDAVSQRDIAKLSTFKANFFLSHPVRFRVYSNFLGCCVIKQDLQLPQTWRRLIIGRRKREKVRGRDSQIDLVMKKRKRSGERKNLKIICARPAHIIVTYY